MKEKIRGLHHVTAIATDPQRNLDFYVGLLGLRFVKRTVNFDDPGSYHFYFGDNRGTPGTILTFFPWPGARRGSRGTGQIEATAFAISPNSTGYWLERFKQHHVLAERDFSIWRGRSSLYRSGRTPSRTHRRRFSGAGRAVARHLHSVRAPAPRISQRLRRLGRLRTNGSPADRHLWFSLARQFRESFSFCVRG